MNIWKHLGPQEKDSTASEKVVERAPKGTIRIQSSSYTYTYTKKVWWNLATILEVPMII